MTICGNEDLVALIDQRDERMEELFLTARFICNEMGVINDEQVYIAPVIMELDQRETSRNLRLRGQADAFVPAGDQAEKAADLHAALTTALSKHSTISQTPGPNILTVTPKVTRLVASRLTLDSRASTLGLDVNRSVTAGGATFEITLSEDQAVLGSLEDKYSSNLNDGAPRIGFWDDADDAFSAFSRKLARYIHKN